MESFVIKIEGMACGKCSERIEKNIINVEGVTSVKAVVADGTVTIEGEGLNKENICDELMDLGFDIV